jgi:adenylate cyclase
LDRLNKEVAPPTKEVAVVFTDIKNSTFLWETYEEPMRASIQIHNMIMRRSLRLIGGYEVKTEGDAFMVAFPAVLPAVHFCVAIQCQLMEADWPTAILETDCCKEVLGPNGELIYRGLSVRMGIHYGVPICDINPTTNRMDYFGTMVNRAARICGAADGGQIFVSVDVYESFHGKS